MTLDESVTITEKLVITSIFIALGILVWFTYAPEPTSYIVETRNEHLIFDSPGCKVYQVVIKNEWGTHVLFITTPTLEQTALKQAVYPTCRVTTP